MSCWNCPRYSRVERICADGKTNPKNKADSVMVAELLGLRALCHYNQFRDRLVALTHFPGERLGLIAVPPRRKRRGRFAVATEVDTEVDPLVASSIPDTASEKEDATSTENTDQ